MSHAMLYKTTAPTRRRYRLSRLLLPAVRAASGWRATLDRLRESENRFRSVIGSMQEGLLVCDRSGNILLCNGAAEELIGQDGLTGAWPAFREDGTPVTPQEYPVSLALASGLPQAATILGLRRPSGDVSRLSVSAAPLFHGGEAQPHAAVATFSDVTERKEAEQRMADYRDVLEFQKCELEKTVEALAHANARLEDLATLDGLTGLKNHRAFQERLAEETGRARRYGTPLSLVMLDVDHFKGYNDAFGHPAGDEVLARVADILRSEARECDLAARYGGEEFALILPQTDGGGAAAIAERCRAAIARTKWPRRPITVSVGAAALAPGMTDGAALIAEADALLYAAKANGRNQVACGHHAEAPFLAARQTGTVHLV